MKCRLLVPQEIVIGQKIVKDEDGNPRLHLDKKIEDAGYIIEDKDAWRLCGMNPSVVLPLGSGVSDVRQLDGFIAEPADEECLAIAKRKGYVPADYVLVPAVTAPA